MGFQFRKIYGLPPTDPRYLDATPEQVLADVWAHEYANDPKLHDEIENPDFEDDLAEMERELGIPAWSDDDARGVTADLEPEPTPELPVPDWHEKPEDWEDVEQDRSPE